MIGCHELIFYDKSLDKAIWRINGKLSRFEKCYKCPNKHLINFSWVFFIDRKSTYFIVAISHVFFPFHFTSISSLQQSSHILSFYPFLSLYIIFQTCFQAIWSSTWYLHLEVDDVFIEARFPLLKFTPFSFEPPINHPGWQTIFIIFLIS